MNFFSTLRSAFYTHVDTVLMLLLFMTIGTKFSVTYFDQSRAFTTAEHQFSSPIVGRDLTEYTTQPVYEIRGGTVPFIFGYGSVTIADLVLRPLEFFTICSSRFPGSCDRILYITLCLGSFFGFALLIHAMTIGSRSRMRAYILYCILLLGVPYTKAIEAGNLDAVLSVIYGGVLYGVIRARSVPTSAIQSILLGVALGVLLSTKAFFILFIGIALLLRFGDVYLYLAFIFSFIFTAMWPRIYGVPSGIFDVFTFALRGSDAFGPQLYTQINYGNNAIISYVSNILRLFEGGVMSLQSHKVLTQIIALCVGGIVFVQPLFAEGILRSLSHAIQKKISWKRYGLHSDSFAIMLFTYATVGMITIPAWSYDYRLLYLLPLIILLSKTATSHHTKELLYLSIALFFIKSVWIPRDRLLNVFLYAHLYLLIRASLSLWKESFRLNRTHR